MLDAWIIEQIKKKKKDRRRIHREQIQIELPADYEEESHDDSEKDSERGVAIVDYSV